MKRLIPIWIKEMVVVFLKEIGIMPFRFVICHAMQNYAQSEKCSKSRVERIYKYIQQTTKAYLWHRYGAIVKKQTEVYNPGKKQNDAPIWIFWWQGEDHAPQIIQCCIASVRQHAGSHPVRVIDAANYAEYVKVPEHLVDGLKKQRISLTHFSDYYRMKLLAERGGLWLDASVFIQRDFSEDIFERSLFTVRNPGNDFTNISNWEWTVGVIGGWKGNSLFIATAELLDTYWRDHDCLIDYFVFDHMIRMIVDSSAEVKNAITEVPVNNQGFYDLQTYAEEAMEEYSHVLEANESTWMRRITWKKNYKMMTNEGKKTVYMQWLEMNHQRMGE